MLKVALCDDEEEQRNTVGGLLRDYAAARPGTALKISSFSSGWALLAAEEETGGFDLYILDIVMPELSGIQLGERLRELGSSGAIIYLTISPEYAVDSYAARAFYYLIKPVEPERLYRVLDQAVEEMEKRKSACIMVKTKDSLQLVRLDDILYVELAGRAVCYHMADGSRVDGVTLRIPFQEEVAPLLEDPRFFQCGASFVANFFYVTAVEKGFLRLDGGTRVPLSRGLVTRAKQRWNDYWMNGMRGTGQ